jgi:hypothetical protein
MTPLECSYHMSDVAASSSSLPQAFHRSPCHQSQFSFPLAHGKQLISSFTKSARFLYWLIGSLLHLTDEDSSGRDHAFGSSPVRVWNRASYAVHPLRSLVACFLTFSKKSKVFGIRVISILEATPPKLKGPHLV